MDPIKRRPQMDPTDRTIMSERIEVNATHGINGNSNGIDISSWNARINGFAHSPGTNINGDHHDMDLEEQRNLERATREVAEWQTQRRNNRDLGCVHWNHSGNSSADDSQDMADNQVLSTLSIAQHEWKKVLDGTRGPDRRPMLPMNDAITNTFWGDECKAKAGNLFRLYVQNVNGLPLDWRGGQFDNLCQVQKETQADVFLGQEHNVDSTQFQVKSILHATCKQHWERYRLNIATTPISFKSMYKPGGTFMLTVGNAAGRIISQTQDKWGRWVSQTFQGKVGRTITIVSAYQVVTDIARGGTTTATTQQYSLLVHDQDSTKAPRAAFRRDLKTYLQQCRQRGDELILVGDFNETIGDDADGMVSVIQGLDMMDMMGVRHTYELPTTYARGRRCLDYGFATANVCASLEACGYESFGHRFLSDHRAYFLTSTFVNCSGLRSSLCPNLNLGCYILQMRSK